MDLKKYFAALQAYAAAQQPSFGNDANTVLELLYGAYCEHVCTEDSDEIKQAFKDLYQAMHGKTLREKDEVINAVCRLCYNHQLTGFIDGIQLGIRLAKELNTP